MNTKTTIKFSKVIPLNCKKKWLRSIKCNRIIQTANCRKKKIRYWIFLTSKKNKYHKIKKLKYKKIFLRIKKSSRKKNIWW